MTMMMMMTMMMWGISWTNKQTNTYICSIGFPLTCKNNYNLFEAREARDEIIL